MGQRRRQQSDNQPQHQHPQSKFPDQAPIFMEIDYWRLLGAGLLGSVYTCFIYPSTYHILDQIWPGTTWGAVIGKSSVEILTVGVMANSVSMFTRGYWQHRCQVDDIPKIVQHVSKEIPVVTYMDARVWFPYNLLAFGWIPVAIRPLTTSALDSFWQTYISSRAHDYKTSHEPPPVQFSTSGASGMAPVSNSTSLAQHRTEPFRSTLPTRVPLLPRATINSSRPYPNN
jgi:Mpv17 / PMP22 family